ncbi:hypothetical protein E2C01_043769 [Portunus trituberculatus]|uniref:Uncharacterized protein n=1 Tax=Portunus trituberculatus TaxID=210409 RepID=A0A5B7G0F6_PORTR|nr:hypothetical protein [Portunus trituberculatus]
MFKIECHEQISDSEGHLTRLRSRHVREARTVVNNFPLSPDPNPLLPLNLSPRPAPLKPSRTHSIAQAPPRWQTRPHLSEKLIQTLYTDGLSLSLRRIAKLLIGRSGAHVVGPQLKEITKRSRDYAMIVLNRGRFGGDLARLQDQDGTSCCGARARLAWRGVGGEDGVLL